MIFISIMISKKNLFIRVNMYLLSYIYANMVKDCLRIIMDIHIDKRSLAYKAD